MNCSIVLYHRVARPGQMWEWSDEIHFVGKGSFGRLQSARDAIEAKSDKDVKLSISFR